MIHRRRRDAQVYPRNLPSAEWKAMMDGADISRSGTPRFQSGTYVSPVDGQSDVNPALVRQNLLTLGVRSTVLDVLNDRQAATLARMMLLDDAVTINFLESPVLPESGVPLHDILDDVSHLIILGSNQWINFFSRSGFLNQHARRFRTTAASLHCATRYAAKSAERIDDMRLGAMVYTGFTDYFKFQGLRRRFVPSLIRSKGRFNKWTSRMAATVAIPGEVVAHTVRVGRPNDIAFGSYGKPSRTAVRETLMGHKLLALASTNEFHSPRADVIVFGGGGIHRGWCDEMRSASSKVGVEMRLCSIVARGAPMVTMTLR